jgi:hypothetical protein
MLQASNLPPSCTGWSHASEEATNSAYGVLPASPSQMMTQYFEVSNRPGQALLYHRSQPVPRGRPGRIW